MLMNKPCWLLLQLVSNINFSLTSLSSPFSVGTAGSSVFHSQDPVGLSPRARTPGDYCHLYWAWLCFEDTQRIKSRLSMACGEMPSHHYMSYLVTWPQKRLAYAPISQETLGEKRWTFRFCQRSGSIKGSYGRVWTGITLTFLSFLYQRPMSFCLSSVR